MSDCTHCNGTGQKVLTGSQDECGVALLACQYCGGDGKADLDYFNVKQITKEPISHYPKLGELASRLDKLFDEYAGEIPAMAALGILEAKKFSLLYGNFEES